MFSILLIVWADNADIVSCAYSGTGALKTDFTRYLIATHKSFCIGLTRRLANAFVYRTGQRTKVGALRDLQNSIVRYVKNNFLDGARQVWNNHQALMATHGITIRVHGKLTK